jgi:hypothetical protein
MNYQEILEVLKGKLSVEEFAYEDYYASSLDLGEIQEVEKVGGEDQGSTWYSVKFFSDHGVYIKVAGWYSSYSRTDFDDWDGACSEVKPAEKTITVYESI